MQELKIDEELKALIPPLRESEYTQLEQNILSEGIREPILIWNGTIIDGHNRYSIAKKHGLNFAVKEMQFDNKDAVIGWMIYNQFGRRNLSAYDRSLLALKLKPQIEAEAKKKMLSTQNNNAAKNLQGAAVQNFVQLGSGKTIDKIAALAGVSREVVRKVEKIEQAATPEIKDALKTGKISINSAYQKITGKKKARANKKSVNEAATIDSLRKELEKARLEIEGWKDANNILEQQRDYQAERAENAVANYRKTDERNGRLLYEMADLKDDLDMANADIAKLQAQLEKVRTKVVPPADYEDLKKEVQALRERLKAS